MNARSAEPLEYQTFDAVQLLRDFPPRWQDRNKQAVWEISNSGAPCTGTIDFARWKARPLPDRAAEPGPFVILDGVFDYPVEPDGNTTSWHLNFADPELFGFYEGSLLAQDELQVAEHPSLGSLRDALRAQGKAARTADGQGYPTPVTVAGVHRRCILHTGADPAAGRPRGLYGNAFCQAPREQVQAATTRLEPPTLSNILAIAAPGGGYGPYTADEIEGILVTAWSGFAAAAQESTRLLGRPARTLIHSGFWGCGAFGGNRTLMTILQALAADLAGVELVFHAVDPQGVRSTTTAHQAYLSLRAQESGLSKLVLSLKGNGYEWGESDGN